MYYKHIYLRFPFGEKFGENQMKYRPTIKSICTYRALVHIYFWVSGVSVWWLCRMISDFFFLLRSQFSEANLIEKINAIDTEPMENGIYILPLRPKKLNINLLLSMK